MRVSILFAGLILLAVIVSGCQIDAPTFVSGDVSAFQAKTSRSAKWQLSPKQLVDLRQWLADRKSGWNAAGKMPPETMATLTDANGKTFLLRVAGNVVMANGKVKEFSEKEILQLRSLLGVTIDG
ncbi:MAG: hypothetical protein H7232_04645 [Aeromicrobium sp.]|nr:hypothetical protein [Burkholderiales bacterium]